MKKLINFFKTKLGIGTGTAGGCAVGGCIGSSMGIVAFGTAIAATLPFAIIGGVIAYLLIKVLKYLLILLRYNALQVHYLRLCYQNFPAHQLRGT